MRPLRYPLAGAVDVVIVGAGHSGLAMSRALAQRGIEHVVLERYEVASAWRRDRWDSLRLLTPNWQSRLPGYAYAGNAPDDFMSAADVAAFIAAYARHVMAPVRAETTVTSVRAAERGGYRVETSRGVWLCRAVVLASGAHALPAVSPLVAGVPRSILSLTPDRYRNPGQLDASGVLVVGASATGVQLADELRRSGRAVTLAVGEHIRLPRTYRGADIQRWLDRLGVLDERYDAVDDIVRARRVPSPQLVGSRERPLLDLNALAEQGVDVVGRLVGLHDGEAQFSGSLANHCAMADLKLDRLLERIDRWIDERGMDRDLERTERFAPTRVPGTPRLRMNLARARIGTVLWAGGFRPDYGWLHVPVLDAKGRLRHDGGVAAVPGLYALGLSFMRRRKSSFIHGADDDTRELGDHLAAFLRRQAPPSARRAAG